MSKPKFTDDFESNVRMLLRRKNTPSLTAAYSQATYFTLETICKNRSDNPTFAKLWRRGNGGSLARTFIEAARWSNDTAFRLIDSWWDHVEALAAFERKQERELAREAA